MSDLNKARAAAAEFLQLVGDDPRPEWRVCHSMDGTDEPTGIAPVCPDDGHDPADDSVYSCCPDPVVECDSYPLAAYLVALLNADRDADVVDEPAPARGSFEIKHVAMRATRAHLAEHPLPEQRDGGAQ